MQSGAVDSPFYTFLPLEPPADAPAVRLLPQTDREQVDALSGAVWALAADRDTPAGVVDQLRGSRDRIDPFGLGGSTPPPAAEDEGAPAQSAKQLLDIARSAMARNDFDTARRLFEAVLLMRPRDEYVVQKLALATYKARQPDPRSALLAARGQLRQLDPDVTNDPETLGLWGAIHKRLWDIDQDRASLDAAINAYERGFYLKQDYYNGINLAFLLNVRASVQQADRAEALADFVIARRVRREVIRYCERSLQVAGDPAAKYWVLATLWEAAFGIGDRDAATRWQQAAEAAAPEPWMLDSTRSQIQRLDQLLGAYSWTVT
jgi:tetratricopeptide (TPR) repeat protein